MNSKPRVIKDFEKLDEQIQEQIKLSYPNGFSEFLVAYNDKEGKRRTALPFETDDRYYLVRMTEDEAVQLIDEDDDFGDDGMLKDEIKEEYEVKYAETDVPEESQENKIEKDMEEEPI